MPPLILASTSEIRHQLLLRIGLSPQAIAPRVDEDTVKAALTAEGATARDIADALAELKARKVAEKNPAALVLGCDQVLALGTILYSKPGSPPEACAHLTQLQGKTHLLLCAVVLYENARPVWRHIATARMTMRALSPAFISAYVDRNWASIRHSVGGYLIEEQGLALFSAIDGEQTAIQGLPIPPLIGYLAQRGFIDT